MNNLNINYKVFFFLTLSFIIMTAVGTITHEIGHYVVAKYLGYKTEVHYKSTSIEMDSLISYFNETFNKHLFEIKNNLYFPEKEKYNATLNKFRKDNFLITLGGPIQTMLTGTIGFTLLLVNKRKIIKENKVNFLGWVFIFMSLFWLRQVFNLFTSLVKFIYKGKIPHNGDEAKLALYLNLNIWTVEIITAFLGLIVFFIVLKIIPQKLRFTFLLSGCIGGMLGFYLWLIKFGSYILP